MTVRQVFQITPGLTGDVYLPGTPRLVAVNWEKPYKSDIDASEPLQTFDGTKIFREMIGYDVRSNNRSQKC